MKCTLIAFGIAKDILSATEVELELPEASTVADVKSYLKKQYPEFARLHTFALAVHETYQMDDFILSESDEIVIIPPVSGG